MSRPRLELRHGLLDCDAERRYRVNALAALQPPAPARHESWGAFGLGVVVFGALWAALAWCAGVLP